MRFRESSRSARRAPSTTSRRGWRDAWPLPDQFRCLRRLQSSLCRSYRSLKGLARVIAFLTDPAHEAMQRPARVVRFTAEAAAVDLAERDDALGTGGSQRIAQRIASG